MPFALPPAFLALAAVVLAILLYPVLRRRERPTDRIEAELAVCRAQLEEVARDRELGLIDAEAARAAEVEIKRRMLALDRRRAELGEDWRPGRGWAVAALAVLAPLAGLALYGAIGRPDLPDLPLAARDLAAETRTAAAPAPEGVPSVGEMVARLEARLEKQPDDVEGWLMLGRSSMVLGRYDRAVEAYRRVRELAPDIRGIDAALGEALIMRAEGLVPPAAREAFEAELARNPEDPRARFYLALAREQEGEFEQALEGYLALGRASAGDAPWLPQLRERIEAVAAQLDRDPAPLLAEVGQGTAGSEDPAALRAQLEANPKDWRGWIRLARLEATGGDPEAARQALDRARELYANAPFVLQQIDRAAADLGLAGEGTAVAGRGPSREDIEAARAMSPEEQQAMIAGMVERLAERLKDRPDDLEGWRMLGRSYRVLGRMQDALAAYRLLAQKLPEDPEAQLDYAVALVEAAGPGAPLSDEAVAVFEKVLVLAPGQPDALFYLGLAAEQRGVRDRARRLWTELLERLPPDTPAHAEIARRLQALGS